MVRASVTPMLRTGVTQFAARPFAPGGLDFARGGGRVRPLVAWSLAVLAVACAERSTDGSDRVSTLLDGSGDRGGAPSKIEPTALPDSGPSDGQPATVTGDATGCQTTKGATLVIALPSDVQMGAYAVASGAVYVLEWPASPKASDHSTLFAVQTPCGAPVALSGGGPTDPGQILDVSNGYVYWATPSGIFRIPTGGGAKTLLATITSAPTLFDVVGQFVFFTDATGSVYRVPIAGGAPVLLASGIPSPAGIAASDQNVYVTSFVQPKYNPLDGGFGPENTGSLWSAPVSGGGTATLLESNQTDPESVVVSSDSVYWINGGTSGIDSPNGDGTIMRRQLAGGPGMPLVTGERGPHDLSLQGDNLYWIDMGAAGSAIRKFVLANGPATDVIDRTILPGGNFVGGVAVDEQHVYWTDWGIDFAVRIWSAPR